MILDSLHFTDQVVVSLFRAQQWIDITHVFFRDLASFQNVPVCRDMTYCQRCMTGQITVDQPRVTRFLCKDFGREGDGDQYVFNLLDARLDLPENKTPDDWEDNYSGSRVRVTFDAAETQDMPVELKYHAVSEIQVMAVPLG